MTVVLDMAEHLCAVTSACQEMLVYCIELLLAKVIFDAGKSCTARNCAAASSEKGQQCGTVAEEAQATAESPALEQPEES